MYRCKFDDFPAGASLPPKQNWTFEKTKTNLYDFGFIVHAP